MTTYRLSRKRRLALFGRAASKFFEGTAWLTAASGLPAVGLKVAAAFTQLLIDQAGARFEAVVDQPIGVLAAGYDVPGPVALKRWWRRPDPPELAAQFAPEIAAGEWLRLQEIHAMVHALQVAERPLLRHVFAHELAENDWRSIAMNWQVAVDQVQAIGSDPKLRSALKDWWTLLTGTGPERRNAEAMATLQAHWKGICDLLLDAV
jgi:hypothetical protein